MKIITNLGYLMKLASELGKAKLTGNKEKIQEAQEAHDAYQQMCLKSDEVRY